MAETTIQDLLEAGVHFGHQTRRWNPKMKKFIFTERNGIYIIDLQKTLKQLQKACNAVREVAAQGEHVLFVGTKAQASSIIEEESERCGQFYVTNRWAGGMLTNYRTLRQSVKRLDHLEQMATDGTYEHLTKKEILTIEKQRDKLLWLLDGIRKMNKLPGLLIVVDTKKEKIAVNEARRLGIPVCAILDTNCDPDPITYPVPANDDAIRSIKVLLSTLTDAVLEGMQLYSDKEGVKEKEQAVGEAEKQERHKKKFGRRVPLTDKKPQTRADESEDKSAEKATPRQKAEEHSRVKPKKQFDRSAEKKTDQARKSQKEVSETGESAKKETPAAKAASPEKTKPVEQQKKAESGDKEKKADKKAAESGDKKSDETSE